MEMLGSNKRHDIIGQIGNTPLVPLESIVPPPAEKGRLWAKIECLNPGGSVKDRIALSMVRAAEESGNLKKGDTVVEATSGNTGIGLAMVCAAKGYGLILTMPEDMSQERKKLFEWFGVTVHLTPAIEGMSGAAWLAGEFEKEGKVWVRQFENPANPEVHYRATGPEIWRQSGGEIDLLVAGVGTGGTITGAGKYLKEKNPALKIIAAEPAASPVLSGGRPGLHRIHGLGAGFVPGVLDKGLIDRVITVEDKEAYSFARRLSRKEGINAGPSSGAAVCAARKAIKEYPGTIVTILPDTADRYLSLL